MRINIITPKPRRLRSSAVIAALTLACLCAGCSTERIFGSSSTPDGSTASASAPSMKDRIADLFGSSKSSGDTAGSGGAAISPVDLECPTMDVRLGASTMTIPPAGGEGGAMALRYQGTIGQMARECKVTSGVMRMKVGVQGRILLGPAGGPGKLDVPMRYAVVKEGPEPKTIVSKYYKIPVTIADGQTQVPFTHIDEDISYPMPPGNDIDAYVVYVGFDPVGEKPAPAKKPPAKPASVRPR